MRARLDGKRAVGIRGLDREGRRLQTCLLGVGRVVDLDGVAMALRPADVHALEHQCEVGGIDAAGAGPDRHERIAHVVLAREQRTDLEGVDRLLDLDELARHLSLCGGVIFLSGHLVHELDVVQSLTQTGDSLDLGLQHRQTPGDALSIGLVVPQIRCPDLVLQV